MKIYTIERLVKDWNQSYGEELMIFAFYLTEDTNKAKDLVKRIYRKLVQSDIEKLKHISNPLSFLKEMAERMCFFDPKFPPNNPRHKSGKSNTNNSNSTYQFGTINNRKDNINELKKLWREVNLGTGKLLAGMISGSYCIDDVLDAFFNECNIEFRDEDYQVNKNEKYLAAFRKLMDANEYFGVYQYVNSNTFNKKENKTLLFSENTIDLDIDIKVTRQNKTKKPMCINDVLDAFFNEYDGVRDGVSGVCHKNEKNSLDVSIIGIGNKKTIDLNFLNLITTKQNKTKKPTRINDTLDTFFIESGAVRDENSDVYQSNKNEKYSVIARFGIRKVQGLNFLNLKTTKQNKTKNLMGISDVLDNFLNEYDGVSRDRNNNSYHINEKYLAEILYSYFRNYLGENGVNLVSDLVDFFWYESDSISQYENSNICYIDENDIGRYGNVNKNEKDLLDVLVEKITGLNFLNLKITRQNKMKKSMCINDVLDDFFNESDDVRDGNSGTYYFSKNENGLLDALIEKSSGFNLKVTRQNKMKKPMCINDVLNAFFNDCVDESMDRENDSYQINKNETYLMDLLIKNDTCFHIVNLLESIRRNKTKEPIFVEVILIADILGSNLNITKQNKPQESGDISRILNEILNEESSGNDSCQSSEESILFECQQLN